MPTGPTDIPADAPADVELRLPADGAWASVLRTTAAALVARLDFTIDDIEDVRMAVGEAFALVLAAAAPGSDVVCGFHTGAGTVTLDLRTRSTPDATADPGGFAWQMLEALCTRAATQGGDGEFRVRFTMSSATAAAPAGAGG